MAVGQVPPGGDGQRVGGFPVIIYEPPSGVTFNQVAAGLPLVQDFVFGNQVTPTSGQTLINNATTLAQWFNPTLDVTGTNKINSELESYATSFTAGNHVFGSNYLSLTGLLAGNGTVAPLVSGSTGANPSITIGSGFTTGNIGLANTNGLSIGQIGFFTYNSMFVISNLTGSGNTAVITGTALMGTSNTLGASAFVPFAFMPYYYANTTAASLASSTTLTFTGTVPAGVQSATAGQFQVNFYNSTSTDYYSSQTYYVQSATANTVTISPALAASDAVASGQGVFFTPPITSGQITTKNYLPAPGWDTTYTAVDATVQVPGSTVYNTAQGFTNAVSGQPYGSWPAMFIYSGQGTGFADTSELDAFEIYNNVLRDSSMLDMNVRIAPAGRTNGTNAINPLTNYLYNPNIWGFSNPNFTYNSPTQYKSTFHHIQLYETPNTVYTYVDNLLVKQSPYKWTSNRDQQLIFDLAIGSLHSGIGTNNLWPLFTNEFPIQYNIQEIKIYRW
jgi:hypothetical protein